MKISSNHFILLTDCFIIGPMFFLQFRSPSFAPIHVSFVDPAFSGFLSSWQNVRVGWIVGLPEKLRRFQRIYLLRQPTSAQLRCSQPGKTFFCSERNIKVSWKTFVFLINPSLTYYLHISWRHNCLKTEFTTNNVMLQIRIIMIDTIFNFWLAAFKLKKKQCSNNSKKYY